MAYTCLYFVIILGYCSSAGYLDDDNQHILTFPRIVWMYFEGTMFDKGREMHDDLMRTLSQNWTVWYLTPTNLSRFINVDSLPKCWNILTVQTKSDYIRLYLLHNFGGWWLDFGLLLSSENVLNDFLLEIESMKAHFFGCCYLQCPTLNIETNFIYAPLGSLFIKEWFREFTRMLELGRRNYLFQLFRAGITFSWFLFEPYPEQNIYMSVYLAQQASLQRAIPRNLPMIIKQADDTIYLWREGCHSVNCLKLRIETQLKNKTFPIMKVSGWVRKRVWGISVNSYEAKRLDNKPLTYGIGIGRWTFICFLVSSIYRACLFCFILLLSFLCV